MFQQVILGLSNAVVVLGSQYWGEKRTGPIKKLSSAAVALGIIFSAILFVFASVMPENIIMHIAPAHIRNGSLKKRKFFI